MTTVSVFIVNYNGAAFIEACLDSLLKSQGDFELDVIVVDNDSTDNSLQVLDAYKSSIQLIKNHHNSGFSRGNNIAAQYAKGEYFFLLNNDTVLDDDSIQVLLDAFVSQDNVGAMAPKLVNEDGSIQCPGSIFGQRRFKSDVMTDVSFIAGAALLMSRSVYEGIGGLDDQLFFYNDDVDLCKTLLKNGYRLVYCPDSKILHYGGLSTKFRKIGSLIEGYRGGFYICYKHYRVLFFLYRFLVLFDIIPRLLFHVILGVFLSSHREYVRLYLTILMINIKADIFVSHPELDVEVIR
jgi:hypothetical protein